MSFIPMNAVSGALSPAQRAANDSLGARRVQHQKDSHHSEEVEELDDTGVSSVHDQRQNQGRGKDPDKKERSPDEPEEKVEIAALNDHLTVITAKPPKKPSGLDISA